MGYEPPVSKHVPGMNVLYLVSKDGTSTEVMLPSLSALSKMRLAVNPKAVKEGIVWGYNAGSFYGWKGGWYLRCKISEKELQKCAWEYAAPVNEHTKKTTSSRSASQPVSPAPVSVTTPPSLVSLPTYDSSCIRIDEKTTYDCTQRRFFNGKTTERVYFTKELPKETLVEVHRTTAQRFVQGAVKLLPADKSLEEILVQAEKMKADVVVRGTQKPVRGLLLFYAVQGEEARRYFGETLVERLQKRLEKQTPKIPA